MKTKDKRGGAGRGQGNKPGVKRVAERRIQQPLTILPSVLEPFKAKYGRGWSRRVEELIRQDLQE
ncbi:hypothetical protein [Chitinophaga japonensis]|uniref:Uncharacterized protein n=1 Tax=Chitinophaga japonensis TaxID=104662 RepID=A0A562SZU6_CHIJA|nr:hypothetical protein [Chitinophaga japonensis]TWI86280.1 hypothetical protein LX66_3534 [Chitinophaga japonensis]